MIRRSLLAWEDKGGNPGELCRACRIPIPHSGWCPNEFDLDHNEVWLAREIGWALFGWFFDWCDDDEAAAILTYLRVGAIDPSRDLWSATAASVARYLLRKDGA